MSEILIVDRFNAQEVITSMMNDGAASVPLIRDDFLAELVAEAEKYSFPDTRKVKMVSVDQEPVFKKLRLDLEELINEQIKGSPAHPLEEEVHFGWIALNRYLKGGYISRHTDEGIEEGSADRFVICSAILNGSRRFYASPTTYASDYAETRRRIPSEPGMVIFIRSVGFMGTERPIYHQVTQVKDKGFSLVFRSSAA